jgi:hypothetical protein
MLVLVPVRAAQQRAKIQNYRSIHFLALAFGERTSTSTSWGHLLL